VVRQSVLTVTASISQPIAAEMDKKWREQAAQRAKKSFIEGSEIEQSSRRSSRLKPEDIDTLDDVLATIQGQSAC